MDDGTVPVWVGRGAAAVAAVGAAVALVGLTTGAWATCTVLGLSTARGNHDADPSRRLDVDLFPDGRVAAHGETSMRQLFEDGEHAAARSALSHAIPGVLDGFAIACAVAIGLLAVVGIGKRLPAYLWTIGCALAVGALTAVAVLRFELLAALAAFGPQLASHSQVEGAPLATWTTAALVVYLVAAAVAAHPRVQAVGE
ncbi:hypothetical protein ACFO1B_02715 [Dactylosporangium siamense]|uniref:Uncharacterized protein n=1 Tax=Dactylosporangium siamense TaxID=685454 RepID=A0A919UEF6_9ACTN|nr:hypothetical protein [Dactylosporangium siamense]GIG48580.1 hypothetical protein Dsi01nite_066210 [Dactylosporangium siamense]